MKSMQEKTKIVAKAISGINYDNISQKGNRMNQKTVRHAVAGAAALSAALVTGCASVEYSSPGKLNNISVKGAPGAEAGQHVAITTSG